MTDTPVAWKFLAETTEPDGQIVRRYCYVAILDRDAARHALTREGWIHQVVQGEGHRPDMATLKNQGLEGLG